MRFIRNIKSKLKNGVKNSPVVLLTGARQTGKTTLMRELAEEKKYGYVTFDDLSEAASARQDPMGYIANLSTPVILDEVQHVPEIFLPIKHAVDKNRHPESYLLTGSANPLLLPRLGDSLAGRMLIYHLFPLSQGELLGFKEGFLEAAFRKSWEIKDSAALPREKLVELLLQGGYPSVFSLTNQEACEDWYSSYLQTLLQRDVKSLANIERLGELPNLLRLLASRVGGLLNTSELSRTTQIANTTLHRYLQLLETLFITNFLPAWSKNFGKRLTKSPKVYLNDCGILSYLLGANRKRLFENSNLLGMILENFVLGELQKQATWSTEKVSLYYMRTQTGVEVDIMLENFEGKVVAIEVKATESINGDHFKHLKAVQSALGEKFLRGFVFYTGGRSLPFGKELYALPVSSLWEHGI